MELSEKKTKTNKYLHQLTEKQKALLFIAACVLVAGFRLILAMREPVWAMTTAEGDDALMVRLGNSLSRIRWLGAYDNKTLIKGISFPAVLMVLRWTYLPLTVFFILLWTLSIALLLAALKPVLSNRVLQFLIFAFLMLHPLFSNEYTGLRVYRNGLTPSQVLLILAGLFGLFLRYRQPLKKLLPWGLLSAFSILFFYYTREDRVWMYPFLFAVSLVILVLMLVHLVREYRKDPAFSKKMLIQGILFRGLLLILPVLLISFAHLTLSVINQKLYGVSVVNEFEEGNFPKALQAMYMADTGDEMPARVSVSREKLKKLCEVSPALKSIEPMFFDLMDGWDYADRVPGDGEVEDGWFLWVFRDTAAAYHYHDSLAQSEAFYGQVAAELNTAMDQGLIKRGTKMPAALMAPLHPGYLQALPGKALEAFGFMFRYTSSRFDFRESDIGKPELVATFEEMANGQVYETSLRTEEEITRYNRVFNLLNGFSVVYRRAAVPLAVLSVAAFFAFLILVCFVKSFRTERHVFIFLMLLSMLLSLVVFAVVIAYNDIASCPTINIGYMVGGYGLMAAWEVLTLVLCGQCFVAQWKKVNRKTMEEEV